MEVTLPILMEVGVTPTSLAVLGPPAPPPPPVAPPPGPLPAAPVEPPVVAPPVVLPAVPSWPLVAPVPDWSVPVWSPSEMPWALLEPPLLAFTNALLGSRVPHACRTKAKIGSSKNSRYLRSAVPSRRRRPPTVPLPVTHFIARTTVGIRRPTRRILAVWARATPVAYPASAFWRRTS